MISKKNIYKHAPFFISSSEKAVIILADNSENMAPHTACITKEAHPELRETVYIPMGPIAQEQNTQRSRFQVW